MQAEVRAKKEELQKLTDLLREKDAISNELSAALVQLQETQLKLEKQVIVR